MANLSLEQLLYDGANNVGPRLGAFLVGKSGNLIDYTNANSKDGLDVYLINTSLTVTATALDIRALTNADVVTAEQGTDPWVVSATALDIRALTNADVVTAEQGTDPWVVSGSVSVAPPSTAIAAAAVAVDDSPAVALPAASLADRKILQIQNLGPDAIFIGPSGVTAGSGLKVEKGATESLEIGTQSVYAICATGKTAALRVLELS